MATHGCRLRGLVVARSKMFTAAIGTAIPAALAGGGTAPASAQSTSADMNVQADVQKSCSITASGINFGVVDTLSTTPKTATGTVTVTCTAGTDWVTYSDDGEGPANDIFQRAMRMQGGDPAAPALGYQIYKDPALTKDYGHPTGGGEGIDNINDDASAKSGLPVVKTIYGKVKPSQRDIPAGIYADRILLSLYIV